MGQNDAPIPLDVLMQSRARGLGEVVALVRRAQLSRAERRRVFTAAQRAQIDARIAQAPPGDAQFLRTTIEAQLAERLGKATPQQRALTALMRAMPSTPADT